MLIRSDLPDEATMGELPLESQGLEMRWTFVRQNIIMLFVNGQY